MSKVYESKCIKCILFLFIFYFSNISFKLHKIIWQFWFCRGQMWVLHYEVMQRFQNPTRYLYTFNGFVGYGSQKTKALLYSVLSRLHLLSPIHFWKPHYKALLKSLKTMKNSWDDKAFRKIFQKEPLKQMREYERHM